MARIRWADFRHRNFSFDIGRYTFYIQGGYSIFHWDNSDGTRPLRSPIIVRGGAPKAERYCDPRRLQVLLGSWEISVRNTHVDYVWCSDF